MLKNIKPQPKHAKLKEGSLTDEEKSLAKGLLKKGYRAQDVTYIMNQGRISTVNQARVSEVSDNTKIATAKPEDVEQYLKIQNAYDPLTLLNPHKDERLIRAREAMLSAVQIFNSPAITFKTEVFSVLANIAWTYLMHEKMERTKKGTSRLDNGNSVTLGGTLGKDVCPIKEPAVIENLQILVKIRDSVEHTYFAGGDECFGALFQACCINFEKHMTEWFGPHLSLANELSLALQFVKLNNEQVAQVENTDFPKKIRAIYEEILKSEFVNDNAFQLSIFYSTQVGSKTKSDVHHLVDYEEGKTYHTIAVKKVNYKRCSQNEIVKMINSKGFKEFSSQDHQQFWQTKWKTAAKRNIEALEFGEIVMKSQWLWYRETWLPVLLEHCKNSGEKYR